jgi:hypothetical protein
LNRSQIKYAACQAAGFLDGHREHSIAQLAADEILDRWPNSLPVVMEAQGYTSDFRKWEKQLRKLRDREEKRIYRDVEAATLAKVKANREAYGVAGILGLIWLLMNIASIVWPIVRALFAMRYEQGHDSDIQRAVGAIQ